MVVAVVPEKLARKLKAFLMMRCASTFVCKGPPVWGIRRFEVGRIRVFCGEEVDDNNDDDDGDDSVARAASWGAMLATGSIDMPIVISLSGIGDEMPFFVGGGTVAVEGISLSSSIISSSIMAAAAALKSPLVLLLCML